MRGNLVQKYLVGGTRKAYLLAHKQASRAKCNCYWIPKWRILSKRQVNEAKPWPLFEFEIENISEFSVRKSK